YHRRRANLNQQRVHQRRKLREFASENNSTSNKQQEQKDWSSMASPSSVSTSSAPSPTSWSWMMLASSEQLFNLHNDDDDLLLNNFELDVEPSQKPMSDDLPLPDLQLLELLLSDNACYLLPTSVASQPTSPFDFLDLNLIEA
ncbi:hypothetical protein Gpo141_00013971, partial [Globisporangium polare]